MANKATKTINVCLVGQKFMGRTHSNAFLKVGKFFDVPLLPVMHTIAGRNETELNEFGDRWGWQNATTDWKKAVTNSEIGLVDIGRNHLHAEMSMRRWRREASPPKAARRDISGRTRQMRDAAKKAKGQQTFVSVQLPPGAGRAQRINSPEPGAPGGFSYPRVLSQDWADWRTALVAVSEEVRRVRRMAAERPIIDMARFITGDGSPKSLDRLPRHFIKGATSPAAARARITAGTKGGGRKEGEK